MFVTDGWPSSDFLYIELEMTGVFGVCTSGKRVGYFADIGEGEGKQEESICMLSLQTETHVATASFKFIASS